MEPGLTRKLTQQLINPDSQKSIALCWGGGYKY